MMSPKEKIDSVWDAIWKDILENPDGTPDMESIKRELHDYVVLFKSVQTAYSRLTGGEINHPFTQLDVLISYVDLYYEEMMSVGYQEEQEEVFQEERASLFDVPYSKATIH
jgi:hypothetical protein